MGRGKRYRTGRWAAALSIALMGFSASGLARSLTLNAVQTFGTIDPAKMTDYTQYLAVVNLYDDLVYASPSGKIIPHLASSWTVGDGGKAYTFKIRPGIRFHDGMPLTAADVVYSMRRLLAIDQGPAFLWQGVLKPSGVTQVGSNQVRFTLIHPYSPFLATLPLLFVLNEKQLVKHQKSGPYGKWGDYGQSWLLNHDAGSGPYTLRTFVDGSQVTFQRFAGYWMGWPKGAFNTVNVIFTNNDSTVLSLARTGRLQLTSQFQAPETYKTLASFPNWKVVKAPSNTIFYLKLNTQKPPTDSRRVRWAIAYAIHYATIQHSLYPGAAPRGLLAPPGSAFSNPNIPELHQDLAKAKAELAKSRYAGKKLHITLTYVAGTAFEQQVALLLQSDLAKIGIQVSIVPAPWNRITQLATSKSQTPNASEVFFGPTYPSPNSVFYTQYDSNAPHTWASMAWLHDPQVNRLIVQAQDASGFAQQKAIYDKLQAILFRLMPDVPLVVQTYEYGMLKSIHGYTYNPIQSFDMNFHNLYWAP